MQPKPGAATAIFDLAMLIAFLALLISVVAGAVFGIYVFVDYLRVLFILK
nr:MAG: hypothetical protein [StochSRVP_11 levi-like virus]